VTVRHRLSLNQVREVLGPRIRAYADEVHAALAEVDRLTREACESAVPLEKIAAVERAIALQRAIVSDHAGARRLLKRHGAALPFRLTRINTAQADLLKLQRRFRDQGLYNVPGAENFLAQAAVVEGPSFERIIPQRPTAELGNG
jgi:hypothetical protein